MSNSGPPAARPAGKGRPTPKRSESERRRTGPVAPPPKDRREAARRNKEQAAASRRRVREGTARGDERYLVKRDAGPVRRLVRDTVDARRTVGVLLLPLALVLVLAQFSGNKRVLDVAFLLWISGILAVSADAVVLALKLRGRIHAAFPQERGMLGHVMYGLLRSTVFRRWRMPAAAVKPGPGIAPRLGRRG